MAPVHNKRPPEEVLSPRHREPRAQNEQSVRFQGPLPDASTTLGGCGAAPCTTNDATGASSVRRALFGMADGMTLVSSAKGIGMETLPRAERLRQSLSGMCLMVAPAMLLVGGILHPTETPNPVRQYEIVSISADRWELAHWLITASMLLMSGAVLGLAHLLHHQRPTEGILGGAIGLVGVMALFAVAVTETIVVTELGRTRTAGAAGLYERIFGFGSSGWTVLLVAVLLLPAGLVVMSIGLFRGRLAPLWTAGALGLGALLFGVSLPTGSAVVFAVGVAAMVFGMAPLGWKMLREADGPGQHSSPVSTNSAT